MNQVIVSSSDHRFVKAGGVLSSVTGIPNLGIQKSLAFLKQSNPDILYIITHASPGSINLNSNGPLASALQKALPQNTKVVFLFCCHADEVARKMISAAEERGRQLCVVAVGKCNSITLADIGTPPSEEPPTWTVLAFVKALQADTSGRLSDFLQRVRVVVDCSAENNEYEYVHPTVLTTTGFSFNPPVSTLFPTVSSTDEVNDILATYNKELDDLDL